MFLFTAPFIVDVQLLSFKNPVEFHSRLFEIRRNPPFFWPCLMITRGWGPTKVHFNPGFSEAQSSSRGWNRSWWGFPVMVRWFTYWKMLFFIDMSNYQTVKFYEKSRKIPMVLPFCLSALGEYYPLTKHFFTPQTSRNYQGFRALVR